MRFLRPSVPILSQKLSFSFFPDVGVRGDFGRGREAIFTVYECVSSTKLTKSAVRRQTFVLYDFILTHSRNLRIIPFIRNINNDIGSSSSYR